jgi:SAM-dependent methyltransferase
MPYRDHILKNSEVTEYVGLDIETAIAYDVSVQPDFTWDGNVMPFEDNSFDCAYGTEFLEHCPDPEKVLKEVYRVLKP